MRKIYKNPKELASCLSDMVDLYFDDIMTYERLEEKVSKIIQANKDAIYKNGAINIRFITALGNQRMEVIYKIIEDK